MSLLLPRPQISVERDAMRIGQMIEFLDETHDSILAIRFTGKLTQADYDQILVPRIEAAAQSLGRVRALRA